MSLLLSDHFVKNWRKRIGNEPTVELVVEIIRHGIIVVKGLKCITLEGRPHTQLAVYWDPALNVVITVDEFKDVAVSVLTGNGKNR